MAKTKAAAKPTNTTVMTQAQFVKAVAEELDWPVRDVNDCLNAVGDLLGYHLSKGTKSLKNGDTATIPVRGVGRVSVKKIPAKPRRKGTNPFTGEEQMFQAKPASKRVRISAAKALRDAV
jgi:nucleoid DNA-binding protein